MTSLQHRFHTGTRSLENACRRMRNVADSTVTHFALSQNQCGVALAVGLLMLPPAESKSIGLTVLICAYVSSISEFINASVEDSSVDPYSSKRASRFALPEAGGSFREAMPL